MKKIAKGEKCRMDKDDVIIKVGPGETAGAIRVRSAVPQFSSGGCPFMTEFELPEADYTTARAAFTAKKDEASKKVKALKKPLGNKWKEVTGQIGPPVAKEKANKTTNAPHIYSQVECTGMNKMHWDDATKTCRKTSEVDLSAQKSSIARPVRLRPTPANAAAMSNLLGPFVHSAHRGERLMRGPVFRQSFRPYTHQKRATRGHPLSRLFADKCLRQVQRTARLASS